MGLLSKVLYSFTLFEELHSFKKNRIKIQQFKDVFVQQRQFLVTEFFGILRKTRVTFHRSAVDGRARRAANP